MTKVLTANFGAYQVNDRNAVGSTLVVLGSKLNKEVGYSLGEGSITYIITDDNGKRGVGLVEVSDGTITSLYVEKAYRRKGIGTALFNLVKDTLGSNKELAVTYPADSKEAFDFFETLLPWDGQTNTVMGYGGHAEPVLIHVRRLASVDATNQQKEQRVSDINRLHNTNAQIYFEPVSFKNKDPWVTLEGSFGEEDLLSLIRLMRSRRIPKEGEPEEPGIDINFLT